MLVLRRSPASRDSDAQGGRHLADYARFVAAQHVHREVQALQSLHESCRVSAHPVLEQEAAQPSRVRAEENRGLVGCRLRDRRRRPGDFTDKALRAYPDPAAIHGGFDAAAGEVRHARGQSCRRPARQCQQGKGHWVTAARLERLGEGHAGLAGLGAEEVELCEPGPPFGEGAGLVEHHVGDANQGFDGLRPREDNASSRKRGRGRRQGNRRRQPERAGTSHHEYGNRGPEGASGIDYQPDSQRRGGRSEHHPGECMRDAIGGLDQARLARRSALDQAPDRGRLRFQACGGHAHFERLADVDRSPDEPCAHGLFHGLGFAGEERLIGAADPRKDNPIRRNGVAGCDEHMVPGAQFVGRHAHTCIAAFCKTQGERRHPPCQVVQARRCRPPRRKLHRPRGEQQEDEHGDRIEIDLSATGPGGPGAGRKPGEDPERYRDVNAQASRTQVGARGRKERAAGKEDHREREDKAGPSHHLLGLDGERPGVVDVPRHGVHHHLHCAEPGHEQAPERAAPFLCVTLSLPRGIERVGVVAKRANGGNDGPEPDLALVPNHLGTPGGIVDRNRPHSGQLAEIAFVEPDAGRTADAFEHQDRFPAMLAGIRDELGLGQRIVIDRSRREVGRPHAVTARQVPGLVVPLEPGIDDGPRDRLAPGAAHLARTAEDGDAKRPRLRYGQPAVKARGHRSRVGAGVQRRGKRLGHA